MSIKDVVLLQKLGLGMLSLTGALVALLGGWILLSALATAPEPSGLAEFSPSLTPAYGQKSEVAELSDASINRTYVDNKVETVSLGCLKDGSANEIHSLANHVRITAKVCGRSLTSMAKSTLVNRANGFEATLFSLAKNQFTSDYVALENGQNKLLLQVEDDGGGRIITELTVLRQRALSPQRPMEIRAPTSTRANETHF